MKRRTFVFSGVALSAGFLAERALAASWMNTGSSLSSFRFDSDLYKQFKDPDSVYRPFVRWWWNGDKVEAKELVRELHLLKEAGIGGVEINPISFPSTGDDLGKKSLTWLSDEWINMLQVTFAEAKKLDMTCDLIVGSGWPFGAETLKGEERAPGWSLSMQKSWKARPCTKLPSSIYSKQLIPGSQNLIQPEHSKFFHSKWSLIR